MSQILKDPIHGSIQLEPLLMDIINTEAFNRLKYVRQLGCVFYVYPGGTHTRFEHSIGVCFLARKFIRMLKLNQEDLDITPQDILHVEIAGLCHDLGHGPFSHVFDGKVLNKIKSSTRKIRHEDVSLWMLEHIVSNDPKVKQGFEEKELDKRKIKNMIDPKLKEIKEIEGDKWEDRLFLYEIVANKTTGIDVDKWDYFIRDCHYMGLQCEFDWKRLMQLSRVIKVHLRKGDPTMVNRICYNQKEVNNILGMFRTRCALHEKAYRHKTVIAVEQRLSRAFLLVKDVKFLKGEKSLQDVFDEITTGNVESYIRLTDDIIHIIYNMKTDEVTAYPNGVEEAQGCIQDIFKRNILHRASFPKSWPGAIHEFLYGVKDESEKFKEKLDRNDSSSDEEVLNFILKNNAIIDDPEFQWDQAKAKLMWDQMLIETSRFREQYKENQDKKFDDLIYNILQNLLCYKIMEDMDLKEKDVYLEKTTLSYGSEKHGDEGPLINSEVLFFTKSDLSSAKPLSKDELSHLFCPKAFTTTEVWVYVPKDTDTEKLKEVIRTTCKIPLCE